MKTIGVLAIQGDFAKHIEMIRSLGYHAVEVRTPEQLSHTDGLIMPGGESTTFLKLFHEFELHDELIRYNQTHPVYGTCAGLIVLAQSVDKLPFEPLNLINIQVQRNAYGRQVDSFIDDIQLNGENLNGSYEGVFIRAPKILSLGPDVTALAHHGNDVVMARSERVLVSTFHPELTNDGRIHKYFIEQFS